MGTKKNVQALGDNATVESHVIAKPETRLTVVEVTGTSDLIQNAFSQKAIEQMLRKHMGLSVQREAKKPREVLEQATIKNIAGNVCIPPVAFKSAMLSASTQLKSLKKTQLRTSIFVVGNSIPITFEKMVARMDMVRTSGMTRTPDVRFRPSFVGWKARLLIQYADTLSGQTILDLLMRAGGVGVGEWRPEKNGTFGTFTVTRAIHDAKEIADIEALCAVPLVRPEIPSWALDVSVSPDLLSKVFGDMGDTATDEGAEKPESRSDAFHEKKRVARAKANGASVEA